MHNLRDLKIWQKAMEVCEKIYHITSDFPKTEVYGLTSKMRRCAIFPYRWVNKSCYELETQLEISLRLGYVRGEIAIEISNIIQQIQKMNYSLQHSLSNQAVSGPEVTYEMLPDTIAPETSDT